MENVEVYPRPVQRPHPPFWVAGGSPESLGWAGRHGAGIMTVAHPSPPEKLIPGMAAWRAGLEEGGHDPASAHCKIHLRVWVDESSEKACETAQAAILRYDDLMMKDRVAREFAPPDQYDWDGMRARGRNVYGNPGRVHPGHPQHHRELRLRHLQRHLQFRRHSPRGRKARDEAFCSTGHPGLSDNVISDEQGFHCNSSLITSLASLLLPESSIAG